MRVTETYICEKKQNTIGIVCVVVSSDSEFRHDPDPRNIVHNVNRASPKTLSSYTDFGRYSHIARDTLSLYT